MQILSIYLQVDSSDLQPKYNELVRCLNTPLSAFLDWRLLEDKANSASVCYPI